MAGLTTDFREAQRLLRLAEAAEALRTAGVTDEDASLSVRPHERAALLDHAFEQVLRFAEHDMGGMNRRLGVISAGVRADAATQAIDIGRSLAPPLPKKDISPPQSMQPQNLTFDWNGGQIRFDPERCAVSSLVDANGRELIPPGSGPAFGEFVHTRYKTRAQKTSVFPEPREPDMASCFEEKNEGFRQWSASKQCPKIQRSEVATLARAWEIARPPSGDGSYSRHSMSSSLEPVDRPNTITVRRLQCYREPAGIHVLSEFERNEFSVTGKWLFHADQPWIDVTYRLQDGWTDDPQTVQFAFPLAMDRPVYRYDAPGAVLTAAPKSHGGDDLPGANPRLFAGLTFAQAPTVILSGHCPSI